MLSSTLTIIAIGVTIIFLVFLYRSLRRESFVPSAGVRFMTAQETSVFLEQDPDGYVKNMSPTDLYARRVSNPEQYIRRAAKATKDFTSAQKIRFTKACKDADTFLSMLKEPHIDTTKLVNIPWVFAMTEGNLYEDGMPHTRANIIFVSSFMNEQAHELVRTMIHEKMHLYQRFYPEDMAHVMHQKNFRRWKQRMGEPRIRANPDVDPWIYTNPENNEPMMALYASDQPANISDIYLNDFAFEHPYEYIAYEIANRYETK